MEDMEREEDLARLKQSADFESWNVALQRDRFKAQL